MSQKCTLEAEGYTVEFEFDKTPEEDWFDAAVQLSLPPELGGYSIKSVRGSLHISGFKKLINYFRQYMESIHQGHVGDAPYALLPLDLLFWVDAGGGIAHPEKGRLHGSFTLEFMVNVGSLKSSGNVYVGGKSSITFESVETFCSSLEQVLAELTRR